MREFLSRTVGAEKLRLPLFVFVALVFSSFGFLSVASDSFSGKSIFQDSDQDGLTNDEEALYGTNPQLQDTDGDGYSDGAEVRSGYNPLKRAPGDKIVASQGTDDASPISKDISATRDIVSDNAPKNSGGADDAEAGNLTAQVSEQIADILKSSTENGADTSASLQEVQANLQDILDGQDIGDTDLPPVDDTEIKVKRQSYKTLSEEERAAAIKHDTLEYITKVSYIMASNAPDSITNPDDLDVMAQALMAGVVSSIESGSKKYLEDLKTKGEQVLLELHEVEVPENMLESHKKAIQLFLYAASISDDLKPVDSDPLANIVVLSKMQGLFGTLSEFVKQVDTSLKEIGIEEIPVDL